MPIWSDNQRLAGLRDVEAHIFWGYRSYLEAAELGIDAPVIIADKGFIDRFDTVFSINREWGVKGEFVSNPNAAPLAICSYLEEPSDGYVLELGQDEDDFSYVSDCDGYIDWLEQWPDRRLRPHPKIRPPQTSLEDDLSGARLVVGLNTSALIAASVAGHKVEAFGAHSMALGIDRGRENALRTIRSYEWDRRDPRAAEAIQAALAVPEPEPDTPKAKAPTQTKSKASRKKAKKKRKT